MKGVVMLCTALVVLAVLRIALVLLAVAFAITLLFFLVTRPRETLTYLGSLVLIGLASERPVAVIVAFGVVTIALSLCDPRRRSRQYLLLTDQRKSL